jgi:WD40 repeat protein
LWDAEHGQRVKSLSGHGSVISRIAWSQDSKRLFSGGMTGVIRWWDAESGANLHMQQGHQGWIRSLSVSPDGSMLLSSGEDGDIHLWDIESAALKRTLRMDRPYERMHIRGLKGVSEAQRAALMALGAVER